jgi:hypothetical protein
MLPGQEVMPFSRYVRRQVVGNPKTSPQAREFSLTLRYDKVGKKRRNDFYINLPARSLKMRKTTSFFVLLLAVLSLPACSPRPRADEPACNLDNGLYLSIDVTDASPRVVFDQLSRELGCNIRVSPFLWKPVTLQVEDASIWVVLARVCPQIEGKYILNGNQLSIAPLTIIDRLQANQGENISRDLVERNRILQSRVPEGMRFTDVPLSSVLDEISQACGLEITPWEDEGDRMVSIDLSGMTFEEAIKAVLTEVDGKGAVWIKLSYGFPRAHGQYWPWGYPPVRPTP